jgi:hypothetical protein
MKFSNLFRLTLLVIAILGLTLAGCKKDKDTETYPGSVSLQQLSDDDESMESAMDESMNDANDVLSGGILKSTERRLPCNASIDSLGITNDTITIIIDYHGMNCNNTRYRTGKVEIKKQVGSHWFQQGASVTVRHINFAITKTSNQKTITLNGVKVHQNVSGGLIWQLGNGVTSAIVHRTWGQVAVTFNNGAIKTWNIARQKTYTGTPADSLVLTTDGFGSADGYENLLVWGISRDGENFYTQIIQPVVHRQVCNWDPCSGIKKHIAPAEEKSATLTFGYNSNDEPITGDECPSKYKLDWQKANHSGTVYLWL